MGYGRVVAGTDAASFKLKLTFVERINGAIRDVFRSLNV